MARGEGDNAVVGAEVGFWHAVELTSACLQEASECAAMLRSESMSHAGTGLKVARALLLLVVGLLFCSSGATAQTCTTGSKAVAIFAATNYRACALLVRKHRPSGQTRKRGCNEITPRSWQTCSPEPYGPSILSHHHCMPQSTRCCTVSAERHTSGTCFSPQDDAKPEIGPSPSVKNSPRLPIPHNTVILASRRRTTRPSSAGG